MLACVGAHILSEQTNAPSLHVLLGIGEAD